MTTEDSNKKKVSHLPNIEHLIKAYANHADGNDHKAIENFQRFETTERMARLKSELMWIRDGIVTDETCNRLLGAVRKVKFESPENWAKMIMIWISQIKK